jgi:uncharacterized membrane protein
LPTWFALIGIGAFAIGWNILDSLRPAEDGERPPFVDLRMVSGLAASTMTVLLGNLGTIRLLFNSFIRVAAPGGTVPVDVNFIQKWIWALKGFALTLGSAQLPIGPGDWYWIPSRVIPAPNDVEPITEFPLFTFLYSDMHAHMIAMPLTLFIIAWAVSFIKSRAQMSRAEWAATFGVGALIIGALRPTNTWDLYTFFPLAALAVMYTLYRNVEWNNRFNLPDWLGRILVSVGGVGFLYALGSLLYSPFTKWYSLDYGAVNPWMGSHTPISSYLTQWGLFLFIIVAWMAWFRI